jgi:hypothetical protein
MKTNFSLLWVSLIALAATRPACFAQDDTNDNSDNTSYESSDATTVVYDAPATYYASVVYQAPVIYNAPVYYLAATATAAASYVAQEQCQRAEPVSTVYVIGGNGGSYSYSNYGESSGTGSTVIQFGQRGGWFGR